MSCAPYIEPKERSPCGWLEPLLTYPTTSGSIVALGACPQRAAQQEFLPLPWGRQNAPG